ncbi:MAG: putative metal binding protein [uncultured marine phage]|uniref:Putative metal binding protein n=1 Tax=uncultured marine phage TaxID=707152 RepID=A0A8D9FQ37_9VIRU|nr:MAG: putative metal binding protein [uncultured marine phage]
MKYLKEYSEWDNEESEDDYHCPDCGDTGTVITSDISEEVCPNCGHEGLEPGN